MLSFSTIWFSPESDLGHKKGGAGEKLAWKEQNGSDQKLSNFEERSRSWPSYKGCRSLTDDSLLWIHSPTERFYSGVNISMKPKPFSRLSWLENVKYTWLLLYNRLVWHQEKLENSLNQEAGQSTSYKPQALVRMHGGGKTNSPTGKRKTLIWDVKKERAPGGGWGDGRGRRVVLSNSADPGFPARFAPSFCWI